MFYLVHTSSQLFVRPTLQAIVPQRVYRIGTYFKDAMINNF